MARRNACSPTTRTATRSDASGAYLRDADDAGLGRTPTVLTPSCPRTPVRASRGRSVNLSRASTSLRAQSKKDVDGRDKPGHDETWHALSKSYVRTAVTPRAVERPYRPARPFPRHSRTPASRTHIRNRGSSRDDEAGVRLPVPTRPVASARFHTARRATIRQWNDASWGLRASYPPCCFSCRGSC